MTPDKQLIDRVRELFYKAQQLPEGNERQEYLAGACSGNAVLLKEVSSLLDAYQTTCGFLEHDASGNALPDAPDLSGTRVNHYQLFECIGEGGFGEVYRAAQLEPLQRDCALKVIKLGMDTRNIVARFKAEQQALARMNHPNIAQVYDAGVTESGRPYFVMELVQGVPILEYCDKHRFPLKDRIALFQEVCAGVQHAHKKGILHRDLKPSNILVSEENGKPLPKIIDFGVAKSLKDPLTGGALETLREILIGTPLYMSPEQLAPDSSEIDARSDIYSLGVILYELIAGTTPLSHKTPSSMTIADMRRALQERELPRPSKHLETLGNKTAVIANRRGTKPQELKRRLRGDLDWVIMKTIEKEPAHRYDDTIALAEDLGRYLNNEPVSAGPPCLHRRFGRFIRWHKMASSIFGSVGLTVLIGAGVMTYSFFHLTKDPAPENLPAVPPDVPGNTHYINLNNPTPVPPYTSRETAANEIRHAIMMADDGDTLEIGDGTYFITEQILLSKALTVKSRNGPDATTIDAGGRCRSFRIPANTGACSVKGLTLTGGFARGGSGIWISGNGPVTIEDCIVKGNRSMDGAGGIAVFTVADESPEVTIRNCVITNNTAVSDGGGIRVLGRQSPTACTVRIEDCVISGNTTASDGGGVFGRSPKGTIIISNCRIENNESLGCGGGIQISGNTGDDSKAIIRSCRVLNNTAGRAGGGINAVMMKKCYSNFWIEDCVASSNTCQEAGGGIRVYSYDGSVTVSRCRIDHNTGDQGGGVMLGTMTKILDSLIYNNRALKGTGGGLRRGPPGGGTVINCTVVGNTAAESGGGAHVPRIINSIIYGNEAPAHPDIMSETRIEFSCSTTLANNTNGNTDMEPQFVDPASGNYRLEANSPCIDAGTTTPTALDLAHNPRTVDGSGDGKAVVDMGAFEFQPLEK